MQFVTTLPSFYRQLSQTADFSVRVLTEEEKLVHKKEKKIQDKLRQHSEYVEDLPFKKAAYEQMFIQTPLAATPRQLELIKNLTKDFKLTSPTAKVVLLIVHILCCQYAYQHRRGNAAEAHQFISSPCDWFKKFRLVKTVKELRDKGVLEYIDFVNKGRYGSGYCRQYRLAVSWKNEFDRLGETGIDQAVQIVQTLVPSYSNPALTQATQQTHTDELLKIHKDAIVKRLAREYARLQTLTGAALVTATASYRHTARCVTEIISRLGWHHRNHRRGIEIYAYRPEYIQKVNGERVYEKNSGFQGLPKAYKDAALHGTNQTMVDMQAGHANIAEALCVKYINQSPLAALLTNGYPTITGLDRAGVKEIILAVNNGASTNLYGKNPQCRTINKVIAKQNPHATSQQILTITDAVYKIVAPIGAALKKLENFFKKKQGHNRGRGTLSAQYQRVEQELITQYRQTNTINSNEHDGWVQDTDNYYTTKLNNNPLLNITSTILPNLTLKLTRKSY